MAAELNIQDHLCGEGECPDDMVGYEQLIDDSEPARMSAARQDRSPSTIPADDRALQGGDAVPRQLGRRALSSRPDGLFGENAIYMTAMPMFQTGHRTLVSCMASGATNVLARFSDAEECLQETRT